MRCFLYTTLAALCCSASFLMALPPDSECRDATPQEKAAAEKLAKTFKDKAIAPLQAAGWQIDSEESALTTLPIASHPGPPRPLMDCARIFDVNLRVNPESPRGQEFVKRAQQYANPSTADEIRKMAAALSSGELEIRVTENEPYLRDERHEPITKMDVSGVPVAYRTVKEGEPKQTVTLCYGAWKPEVTFGPTNKYIPFPFVHKSGTPYIENMCVKVVSTADVVDEVLKQVKWAEMNQALTP